MAQRPPNRDPRAQATWADSVQQFSNPACLDASAVDLGTLLSPAAKWTRDPQLHKRSAEVTAAIKAYYNRTGCTDMHASNYNASALVDDGSRHAPSAELQRLLPSPPAR